MKANAHTGNTAAAVFTRILCWSGHRRKGRHRRRNCRFGGAGVR